MPKTEFIKAFLQIKGLALTSDYICLQKIKKGTLFYQLALVATRLKRVPFFINFAVTQKDWQGC